MTMHPPTAYALAEPISSAPSRCGFSERPAPEGPLAATMTTSRAVVKPCDRRQQRQGGGGRVAAGHGDCSGACQLVSLAGKLRQPVRPGAGMCRLVKPLPRLRLREPEVGATIDDQSVGMQLRSHLTRSPMRQSEEDHVVISKHLEGGLCHQPISQWSQLRMVLAEECSRIGASRHGPDLHLRMRKQQSEQLSARIASGACHRSPHSHPHEYAMIGNFMHLVSQELNSRMAFDVPATGRADDSRYHTWSPKSSS